MASNTIIKKEIAKDVGIKKEASAEANIRESAFADSETGVDMSIPVFVPADGRQTSPAATTDAEAATTISCQPSSLRLGYTSPGSGVVRRRRVLRLKVRERAPQAVEQPGPTEGPQTRAAARILSVEGLLRSIDSVQRPMSWIQMRVMAIREAIDGLDGRSNGGQISRHDFHRQKRLIDIMMVHLAVEIELWRER